MRYVHLFDRLEACAGAAPDRVAFSYAGADDAHDQELTYGMLRHRALTIATRLQQCYAPGERALLLFPPGLEFIEAFFGCVYAGLIAVPVCPPRRFRPAENIASIVANASPALVLSTEDFTANRAEWFDRIPALLRPAWLGVDSVTDAGGEAGHDWRLPDRSAAAIGLLQYTSGTTGSPKGVMVSHGNLAHNAATIRRAFGPGDHSLRAFWLPLYHDMGLIGAMLQTVFDGATSAWISPATFLQRPLSWLELITRTGASMSGAPDFAYQYCAQRAQQDSLVGLDLSRWTVAVSGAETIRPATIDRFSATFADCGFRREAFQPGYGLAEATLVVAHEPPGEDPKTLRLDAAAITRNEVVARDEVEPGKVDAPRNTASEGPDAGHTARDNAETSRAEDQATETRIVASSGEVGTGQEVAIVDPAKKQRCAEGTIGEIWVAGPNVAQGYYNNSEATAATFHATLPGDARRFLRTGDLGFLRDGRLFVTGRLKELIVVRGRNLYPQDLEWAVRQSDPRVRHAAGAVFAVDLLGAERLVVVQEVERAHRNTDFADLGQAVRRAIGRVCGAEVFDLMFVHERSIPRTTSGKVRRLQCRADYLAERIEVLARWTARLHEPQRQHTACDVDNLSTESGVGVASGDHTFAMVATGDATADQTHAADKCSEQIRDWLLARIAERLDVAPDQLDEQQAFSEMGLGSLDMVLLCDEFEQWLGQRMPPTMIYNYPTITALAEHLGQSEAPVILPLNAQASDGLRAEVAASTDDELAAFIAQEMTRAAGASQRRAA